MGPSTTTCLIADPRATAPDSPFRPTNTQATSGVADHSGCENGQGFLSPGRPSKAPRAKTLGPTILLACALTSACPSARCTDGGSELPASRGLTLTLGWPPESPSQEAGLATQGLGTPEPELQTQLAAPPPPGPLGAPPVIQGGRTGRSLQAPGDF